MYKNKSLIKLTNLLWENLELFLNRICKFYYLVYKRESVGT